MDLDHCMRENIWRLKKIPVKLFKTKMTTARLSQFFLSNMISICQQNFEKLFTAH